MTFRKNKNCVLKFTNLRKDFLEKIKVHKFIKNNKTF